MKASSLLMILAFAFAACTTSATPAPIAQAAPTAAPLRAEDIVPLVDHGRSSGRGYL